MLTVDIALPDVEELQKLFEAGKEKGFLTYDEVVAAVDELDLSKDQLEDFATYIVEHGVELVEGEQHKALPHEQPAPEEEKAPKLDLSVEPSLDSLRLYLRDAATQLAEGAEKVAAELDALGKRQGEIARGKVMR